MIVLGHLSLTFKDLDEHTWLIISVCSESLLLLGGNGGVPGDQSGHDLSCGLNTLGEWCNIEKKQILDGFTTFSREDGSLNGGSVCDSFIWVD
jgi:hypothetical protein